MSTTLPPEIGTLSAMLDALIARYGAALQGLIGFRYLSDLLADTDLTGALSTGDLVWVSEFGGFALEKVDSGTVHHTTEGGSAFRVIADRISPMMLGAVGDGVEDDSEALDAAEAADALAIDLADRDYEYVGTWATTKPIYHGRIIDDATTHDYRLCPRPISRNDYEPVGADLLRSITVNSSLIRSKVAPIRIHQDCRRHRIEHHNHPRYPDKSDLHRVS